MKNKMATSIAGATGWVHQHVLPTIIAFVSSVQMSAQEKKDSIIALYYYGISFELTRLPEGVSAGTLGKVS